MKIEGYEEISKEEYKELPSDMGVKAYSWYERKTYFFKKAQKFPICFKGRHNDIEIQENNIKITSSADGDYVRLFYDGDFPLLVKAVEKAKEIANKK